MADRIFKKQTNIFLWAPFQEESYILFLAASAGFAQMLPKYHLVPPENCPPATARV